MSGIRRSLAVALLIVACGAPTLPSATPVATPMTSSLPASVEALTTPSAEPSLPLELEPTVAVTCEHQVATELSPALDPLATPAVRLSRPVFTDETGLVESCFSSDGPYYPTWPIVILDFVDDPINERLQISWAGTACEAATKVTFARIGGRYTVTIDQGGSGAECEPVATRRIGLHFGEPVHPGLIDLRMLPSDPPGTPPPSPGPEGSRIDCPYLEPAGRIREIWIVDHSNLVASCSGVIVSGSGASEVTAANPGGLRLHLDVDWPIDLPCAGHPVRLEFWGPHITPRPSEDFETDADLWIDPLEWHDRPDCPEPVGTQGVRLELTEPIVADQVRAFIAHDGASSDRVATPHGDFAFELSAAGSEFRAQEPIQVEASLEYIGPEPSMTIEGASEHIRFSIEDLGGWFGTSPVFGLLCGRHVLEPGEPDVVQFYKIGGYSGTGPHVDFYRRYFDDPDLRLPAGTYRISAGVGFNIGYGTCHDQGNGFGVGTSIVVHVR